MSTLRPILLAFALLTPVAAAAGGVLVMRVEGSAEPPSSAGVVIAALAGLAGAPELKLDVREGRDAAREFKAAVRKGEAALAEVPLAVLARESALYAADQIPFLATSRDGAKRLYGQLALLVARRLAEDDLVLLGLEPRPPLGLLARRRIDRVHDLKGMKLLATSAALQRLAELAEAVPVTDATAADAQLVSVGDALEMALASKAQGAGWTFHRLDGWHPARALVMSAAALAAQPPAVRQRLTEGVAGFADVWWRSAEGAATGNLRKLADAGVTIIDSTPQLAPDLQRIGWRMAEEWAPGAGADGAALLAALRGSNTTR